MIKINKGMAGFGLARSDGQLLIVSKIPKNVKLPNLMNKKESKESFLKAIQSKTMQIGQTYFMKQLQKWVIPIRARIVDEQGNIPLVMTAGLNIDGGETSWNSFAASEDIIVQVVRKDGFTQFQHPVSKDAYQKTYRVKLTKEFLNQLYTLNLKNKSTVSLDPFYDNNKNKMISVVSYLEDYELYTVVSTPYEILYSHLKKDIINKLSIMLVIILILFILFKIINNMQKAQQKNFQYIATHDALTQLPNRLFLSNEIEKRVSKKRSFFLLFLDFDNFNHINDTYGHNFGDKILKQVGAKLKTLLNKNSFIARQSGDEFIILYETNNKTKVSSFLKQIFNSFSLPFVVENIEIYIGASIGISKYPEDGDNAEILFSKADIALNRAKINKGTFLFFDKSMKKNSKRALEIESELRQAIKSREIFITYQPKIDTITRQIVGVEALIRWCNRKLGIVQPLEFIPIAEKSGLIRRMGIFVLNQSTKEIKEIWEKTNKNFKLSINLSTHQLANDTCLEKFLKIIKDNDFPANKLMFEITESALIQDIDGTIKLLEKFRKNGMNISLDDFGTGFSSLSILSKLPINELKIDKPFIQNLTTNQENLSLTKSIIDIGNNMNIDTVAEGVESPFELEILRKLECSIIQGYYYSQPLRKDELIKFITEESYLDK